MLSLDRYWDAKHIESLHKSCFFPDATSKPSVTSSPFIGCSITGLRMKASVSTTQKQSLVLELVLILLFSLCPE